MKKGSNKRQKSIFEMAINWQRMLLVHWSVFNLETWLMHNKMPDPVSLKDARELILQVFDEAVALFGPEAKTDQVLAAAELGIAKHDGRSQKGKKAN